MVLGGGTIFHVRNHLALCAPAFGTVAGQIAVLLLDKLKDKMDVQLHLTKMADQYNEVGEQEEDIVTNEDVQKLVDKWKKDLDVKIVVFSAAMCDFEGHIVDNNFRPTPSGKYEERLHTRYGSAAMTLTPATKVIKSVREGRKDIFLIGFKTTCGLSENAMYIEALSMMKENSCNLVLANDTKTRLNMIVTPEEARYCVTKDRELVLNELTDMAIMRSQLTFTQSSVVEGHPVEWTDKRIPETLKKIVEWCVLNNAYKVFKGATVGHFACKLGENEFLTSIRKTNFNDIDKIGMVRIVTNGPDTVLAYGAKPSVGGQSQRIVFKDHPEYDCILHFHCPLKENHKDKIPVVSQREYECGSHECGRNTSKGLDKFGNLSCVMLDNHGPNIVFNSSISLDELKCFILENFDLSKKTGGPVFPEPKPLSEIDIYANSLQNLKNKQHDYKTTT